jgi:tetratricopeptide (TPR) repeat protein
VTVLTYRQDYSREETLRLLGVSDRQLKQAEKHGLARPVEKYSHHDLVALRTLFRLLENKTPPIQLRRALEAVRSKLEHVQDPLRELRIVSNGRRIEVFVGKQRMEPVSGQLLLDFDESELKRLVAFPEEARARTQAEEKARKQAEAQRLFELGVQMEQTGAPPDDTIEIYEHALKLDTAFAWPAVNIGTLYFNQGDLRKAERYYKLAIERDPTYALAHFNVGNLYDERGDRKRAKQHYELAVGAQPGYADAHYNLALLLQNSGDLMRAASHWQIFLKLDPASSWSDIARKELQRLRRVTVVEGRKH